MAKNKVITKQKFPRLFIFSLALLLLGIGLSLLPLWQIKTVTVINNSYVPKSYILAKLTMPKAATLWTIRTKDISAQFANDRYVKGVTLRRHFPRTLILAMHIREPFYKATLGEELYVFDETGLVLNAQPPFTIPTAKCFKLTHVRYFKNIPRIVTALKPALPQLKVFNDPTKVVINCRNLDAIQVVY
jgi:cell division septal protein FtsQ